MPSDHLSNYYNIFPTVQFHAFAWFWCKNFYRLDFSLLLITLLTFYLSFKYYLIESTTEVLTFSAGSLSTSAFGAVFCNFCIAAICISFLFYNSANLVLHWSSYFFNLSFYYLYTTSWSKISVTCFLVGDLASCYILSFWFNFLTSVYKSWIIISYFLFIFA